METFQIRKLGRYFIDIGYVLQVSVLKEIFHFFIINLHLINTN
jgi:hypothetical protein